MNVLVDTDVVIEYLRGHRAVVIHFSSPRLTFYCSSITLSEVGASRHLSHAQRSFLGAKLRTILRVISHRDPVVMAAYDDLMRRHRADVLDRNDAVIAATAIAKRMPLWTHNRRHFEPIKGLRLFSPTVPSGGLGSG